ncbi:hypothetical protein CC80DRAFT_154083 [Byssothecium circinans]|uniref:Uncharacterized protein n=1 Tax=Byssothecium circinans TaxID=147558 RepID=A0A6A5UCR3_9PLEO|nr:hypothetical protein CC80DRAFT_154083 [Byssothecium circinans]
MPLIEVLRYKDARGDTIIIKFDIDKLHTSAIPIVGQLTRSSTPQPQSQPRPTSYSSLFAPKNASTAAQGKPATPIRTEITGPIEITHEWSKDFTSKTHWTSILLSKEDAIERFKKDKKPSAGHVLWQGKIACEGMQREIQVQWVGFERCEIGCVVYPVG